MDLIPIEIVDPVPIFGHPLLWRRTSNPPIFKEINVDYFYSSREKLFKLLCIQLAY